VNELGIGFKTTNSGHASKRAADISEYALPEKEPAAQINPLTEGQQRQFARFLALRTALGTAYTAA